MALVNLKSDLANYRAPFTTPSVESQAVKKLGTVTAPRTSTKPTDSKLDIDSTLTKFSVGKYIPTKLYPESVLKPTITRWSGTVPPAVNYFDNTRSGAKGFTTYFTDPKRSNFLGISNSGTTYTYPATVQGNRLMNPPGTVSSKPVVAFPGPQNFLDNLTSGAKGFTLKSTDPYRSNFLGISSSGTIYIYPNTVRNGRLWKPNPTSHSNPIIAFPGPQNFLSDEFATGFTNNMYAIGAPPKSTQFTGYDRYASKLTIKDYLSTGPTGWTPGITSFDRTLGDGKYKLVRDYERGIEYNWFSPEASFNKGKESAHTGFNANNKYVRSGIRFKGYLAATYNTNSPIDDVYKKFNIQDEAWNSTYIKQPFIVRGIQRKGITDPEHWGTGSDDGLIRGGISTVLDRSAADVSRITQWLSTPKGLSWIVKQRGLGLTNPKTEPLGVQLSRVHLGIPTLLSVAGSGLGLHFPSHGTGIGTDIANYGAIPRDKKVSINLNRLVILKNELLSKISNKGFDGEIIKTLSGLAGPQSVYGIGNTDIRRYVDTQSKSVDEAEKFKFNRKWFLGNSYAANLRASSNIVYDKKETDNANRSINEVDQSTYSLSSKLDNIESNQTPGATYNGIPVDLSTNTTKDKTYRESSTVNNYITLAYGKIPTDKNSFRDFRNDINATTKLNPSQTGILGTGTDDNYYKDSNLEIKYGFGKLADTSKVPARGKGSFIVSSDKFDGENSIQFPSSYHGDKVNAIDIGNETDNPYPDGSKDLIEFYFEDGTKGINVMPFRCTITGLSDSFTPGWDKIDIMGRPDGAYLYTSFERSISFNFRVAAMSRSEMIPIWRKLNYLATYTMPDFRNNSIRPAGPFMSITIGNLFQQTPGFISSLTYTIDDETPWDIADDYSLTNTDPKQLPMIVDAAVSFTVVGDYRPQLKGRAYSLSRKGTAVSGNGNWLNDSAFGTTFVEKNYYDSVNTNSTMNIA